MADVPADEASRINRKVGAAPAALAEAVRVVAEDAGRAVERARDMIVRATSVTEGSAPAPQPKGSPVMATSFDTAAFTPSPEKFQSLFGDFQDRAKSGMEKGAKVVEELGDFTRGNMDALLASGRAAAKGAETIGQDAASYGRKSLENATTAFKGFASAKSPSELMRLQSEFAKSAFEDMVAEGSRLTETMLKLMGEIAQPLSTRAAVAADKVKTGN